jgi:hypothetical protein
MTNTNTYASDMRRAAALVVHHSRANSDGCNEILQEALEADRISELIVAILDLYQTLIPVMHTPLGVTALNGTVLQVAQLEASQ